MRHLTAPAGTDDLSPSAYSTAWPALSLVDGRVLTGAAVAGSVTASSDRGVLRILSRLPALSNGPRNVALRQELAGLAAARGLWRRSQNAVGLGRGYGTGAAIAADAPEASETAALAFRRGLVLGEPPERS